MSAADPIPVQPSATDKVPAHNGQARPKTALFFVPPPDAIGQLLSAESTVRPDYQGQSPGLRLAIGAILGVCVCGLFELVARQVDDVARSPVRVAGVLFALVMLASYYFAARLVPVCTYVGQRGVASYRIGRGRSAKPVETMLLFDHAHEVRSKQTRHYLNGAYTGTFYDYRWTDTSAHTAFRLQGKHQGNKGFPKAGDKWHFANAAEIAWSYHLLAQLEQRLTSDGTIAFPIDKKRSIRVGPGFLEFHFGGAPVRLTQDEIASVSLNNGQFSFKHKDAKWYSRQGKYSFPYGEMANAKVFLLVLEKLMGYRWS